MTYLARDFVFEINSSSTFIPISGIQEWSFTVETERQDATTVGSDGWKTEIPTLRKAVIECSGFVAVSAGGVRDSGQMAILNAATAGTRVQFRVSTTVQNSGTPIGRISGNAYIELTTGAGGGTADLNEFAFRVHFVGQPTFSGIFA